jgi:trk system potassium uptake protein
MNWLLVSRMLGMLVMLVGGSMVFSLPWAFPALGQAQEFETRGFWAIVASIGCALLVGGGLYRLGRNETSSILRKEALAVVGLGWLLAGIVGSLPFLLSHSMRAEGIPMSVVDALFESISGFTTTGASVLTELEDPDYVPRCVMFWRSFTHWLGGMGIIVLFVAILGQLGAGGKALMRREVPGPVSDTVRPRVQDTAMVMWTIYVVISAIEAVILMLEGLSLYDALCHTFGTMATGGFSTYNKSLGHFQSHLVEGTIVVFMVLAGTNFSLYYLVVRRQGKRKGQKPWDRLQPLFRDPEFRVFLSIIAISTVVLTVSLWWNSTYPDLLASFRHAVFNAVSIMTTTGYGTEDFTEWSEFAKGLLLLLMFVGGSAGSTGGGIKVIRFILFLKVIGLEIERAYRPNVVRPLRLAGANIDDSVGHDVVVYFSLVLAIFVLSWVTLAAIEPDTQWQEAGNVESEKLLDCASAVAATLNNIGPGLGVLGPHSNYTGFSPQGKLLLTLLMLMGRLELFAILVLLAPSFWRTQ